MDEEKKFGEVVERTEAFLDYKNIDLQKSQNLNFFKRDSPWVLSKMQIFPFFVLMRIIMRFVFWREISLELLLVDILDRKEAF